MELSKLIRFESSAATHRENLHAHIARHENETLFDGSVEKLDDSFANDDDDHDHDDADADGGANEEEDYDELARSANDSSVELEFITADRQPEAEASGAMQSLGEEACMCDTCQLIFSDLADLEAHIEQHHSDQMVSLDDEPEPEPEPEPQPAPRAPRLATAKSFKCARCAAVLDSQRAYDEHELEHDLTDAK